MPPTVKLALQGSLEDWLEFQLAAQTDRPGGAVVDVGAYHGDFAARLLARFPERFTAAVLVEPNPENQAEIRRRLGNDGRFHLVSAACDTKAGTREFNCAGPSYTGSLLTYTDTQGQPVQRLTVPCVTLDEQLHRLQLLDHARLLKIDTQGHDLAVLRGATETLRRSHPWIVVELIYAPLYQSQARPEEIAVWLAQLGYVMAAHFNEYYNEAGFLAWADACFVPAASRGPVTEQFCARPTFQAAADAGSGLLGKIRKEYKRWLSHGRH